MIHMIGIRLLKEDNIQLLVTTLSKKGHKWNSGEGLTEQSIREYMEAGELFYLMVGPDNGKKLHVWCETNYNYPDYVVTVDMFNAGETHNPFQVLIHPDQKCYPDCCCH